MKPFVLLTPAHQINETELTYHQVMRGYTNCIFRAGAVPIVMTHMPEKEEMDRLLELCSGLMLIGGVDVHPKYFGESEVHETCTLDDDRDDLEFPLLDMFVKAKKPILAICRGMQVVHTYFGGTLYQDLPSQKGVNHRAILHNVKCEKGSILERLFGEEFEVNSFHHQAAKDMGEGMRATAWGEDGIVEAIEHESLPIWAVQFHPERLSGPDRKVGTEAVARESTPDFSPFFEDFVKALK